MGKTKLVSTIECPTRKNKKISKKQPLDNKISIKKFSNDKQIIAEFPLIQNSEGQQVMSIPLFRNDKLHYTPGFCLADEFTNEYRAEQEVLQEYRINSQNSMIDAENIRIPKPSSRNSYCTICKIRFEDYRQHIVLEEHIRKMKSSPFCKQIEEMANKKKFQRLLTVADKNDKIDTNFASGIDEVFSQQKKTNKSHHGDTKESLYEKINQQCLRYKATSIPNLHCQLTDNLFDVLC